MHISSLVQSYRLPGHFSRSAGDGAPSQDKSSFPARGSAPASPTVSPLRTSQALEALLAESALDRAATLMRSEIGR